MERTPAGTRTTGMRPSSAIVPAPMRAPSRATPIRKIVLMLNWMSATTCAPAGSTSLIRSSGASCPTAPTSARSRFSPAATKASCAACSPDTRCPLAPQSNMLTFRNALRNLDIEGPIAEPDMTGLIDFWHAQRDRARGASGWKLRASLR